MNIDNKESRVAPSATQWERTSARYAALRRRPPPPPTLIDAGFHWLHKEMRKTNGR